MKIKVNHNVPKPFTINDYNVSAGDVIELSEIDYHKIDIYWKQYITILEKDKPKVQSARFSKATHKNKPNVETSIQPIEQVVEKTVSQDDKEKLELIEVLKQKPTKYVSNKKT